MKSIHPSQYEKPARKEYSRYNHYFKFRQFLSHMSFGPPDACWLWEGCTNSKKNKHDYGLFIWKAKKIKFAHVAAYEFFKGSRKELKVCHTCDTPSCVNPAHLWLGTQKQNIEDCSRKHRMHEKLSVKDMKKIRKLYSTGKYSQYKLAIKFSVTQPEICLVVNRKIRNKYK
jgi:hypothetical protein